MTRREAADLNTVLLWAADRNAPYGAKVTDVVATLAARRLTARARKTLGTGLRPEQVELTRKEMANR